MKENKPLVVVVSLLLVIGMVLAATRGLGLGKWVHNAGGLMLMLTFAALILLPLVGLARGSIVNTTHSRFKFRHYQLTT
jgi:hypothetical protein